MKRYSLIAGATLLLATSGVIAAEEEKEKSPWTSSAEVGYVNTSGNTNTSALKLIFDIAYEVEKWKHAGHFDTLQAETDDIDTADKWLASYQADYKIDDKNYVWGRASYEDDAFSGFEYQAKLSAGYGRKIDIKDNMVLDLEIGPGYRHFKDETQPDSEDEALLRLFGKYIWNITDTSSFDQELTADYGEKQEEWKSVTALTAKINTSLAMKLSYTVKYLDEVPVGKQHYDRESVVTLVYTF